MKNRTISVKELFAFVVLTILLVVAYFLYLSDVSEPQIQLTIAGTLYTAVFIFGLYIIRMKTGSALGLMSFFWTSFFLFHGAQVLLHILGMGDYKAYNIFTFFHVQDIVQATYYSTICELFFIAGMLLNSTEQKPKERVILDEYRVVLRNTAIVLLAASSIPFVIYIYLILRAGVSAGYGAINDYSNYSSSTLMKIVGVFVDVFLVGAFMMIISSYQKKAIYRSMILIVVLYSVVLLALGERTEPTSLILLVLWIDNYLCRMSGATGRAKKKTILMVILLFFLVVTFPSIMALRHSGIISVSELISNVRKNGLIDSLKESVAGLGYSMMPLIEVRRLVASGEPLRYGVTYAAASTNVVPYLGFAKQYATLSTWLMNKLHMSYGPGFSMAAEAYLNFKDFPFPLMIFGYFFSKILMWKKDEYDVRKLLRGIIFIITCLTLPRRDFCGRVRDIAYLVILLPLVIDGLYYRRMTKKGNSTRSIQHESSSCAEQTG